MATNTQRNSTNVNGIPTVTIVDAAGQTKNDKKARRNCCGCVPESVGVFAILSMYFFLGIFIAAASFVSLGYTNDVPVQVFLSISGCLHTFLAITSALGVSAIKKEKIVMMRRLSIAIWILTALMLIFNIIIFILDVTFKSASVEECEASVIEAYGPNGFTFVDCNRVVNESLTSEAIKLFIVGTISIYFAYVVFRYTKLMKKEVLPFTAPIDGQNTPTYFVYSTQPPTSNNWVPPPTYSVKPTNPLPDDFNPDSKQIPN